jgi:hypothetical protein
VADFSGLYGSQNISAVSAFKVNTNVNSVVLGPRVSVPVGKFTPFAEALFGASHIHDTASGFSESDTSFATALGGGILAVSPGRFGIAVISPPLDDAGNSVRAQKAIADISNALGGNPLAAKAR